MNAISLYDYRVLELHYYNLEQYISKYGTTAGTIIKGKVIKKDLEIGSDSKKDVTKLYKLKKYQQELSNFLHKQTNLVYPLLNDSYNGETI